MARKIIAAFCAALISIVALANCVGSMTLTLKLHKFVLGIGNKWVSWLVFLVCLILPVYGLAMLVDIIVLNSIEFWTGGNPAAHNSEEQEFTKEVVAGNERAVFRYSDYGRVLDIEMYRNGRFVKTLHMDRAKPGQLFTRDSSGELARIQMDLARGPDSERAVIWEGSRVAAVRELNEADRQRYRSLGQERETARALVAAPRLEAGLAAVPAAGGQL